MSSCRGGTKARGRGGWQPGSTPRTLNTPCPGDGSLVYSAILRTKEGISTENGALSLGLDARRPTPPRSTSSRSADSAGICAARPPLTLQRQRDPIGRVLTPPANQKLRPGAERYRGLWEQAPLPCEHGRIKRSHGGTDPGAPLLHPRPVSEGGGRGVLAFVSAGRMLGPYSCLSVAPPSRKHWLISLRWGSSAPHLITPLITGRLKDTKNID